MGWGALNLKYVINSSLHWHNSKLSYIHNPRCTQPVLKYLAHTLYKIKLWFFQRKVLANLWPILSNPHTKKTIYFNTIMRKGTVFQDVNLHSTLTVYFQEQITQSMYTIQSCTALQKRSLLTSHCFDCRTWDVTYHKHVTSGMPRALDDHVWKWHVCRFVSSPLL